MSSFRERIEKLSPQRLALLAIELQNRLETMERERNEPIAIVGIGCRIPGAEAGPDAFWRLLEAGQNAVTEVPPDRWDAHAYFDPDPDAPGRIATRHGSFLQGVDLFDAPLFGISRREATGMDPQQRILLEVCWEALEHAGYSPRSLSGSSTGVFVGLSTGDYFGLLRGLGEVTLDAYTASGNAHSVAAGRISYVLGLEGPSMAIDTSCSSSLVAVHLACQSLAMRECSVALAGGVNVILTPEVSIGMSRSRALSVEGCCKTFDSRADGYIRGEGCGIVALKRLADAVTAGDNIWAVIRGSAVNQDGRSNGLTAPNGAAQEAVILQALKKAGVAPAQISYVEAHGTGTPLGDPIEAHALASALAQDRDAQNPLLVGSVKTNLGHLESAAGVAGLIKVVLALEHERIPRNLHFHELNPHIDWKNLAIEVPVETRPWKRGSQPRVAGVSSFGFSGTNAHLIVEEAPERAARVPQSEPRRQILVASARTESSLASLMEKYAARLETGPDPAIDVCFTANAGRAALDWRVAVTGETTEELAKRLRTAIPVQVAHREGLRPVFLFPGQGAQYRGMGRELYETQPVFRETMARCSEILKDEIGERLEEILWGARQECLDETRFTQPAMFAIEYSLAQLWRSWGIEPATLIGHSAGEYVAACVAGVYGLEPGLKLMARRGRLTQQARGEGAMAAVFTSAAQAAEALRGFEGRVSIAAINSPENVVIAGYRKELEEVERGLLREGVRVERLPVSQAFHSPQMDQLDEQWAAVLKQVDFATPQLELISSVTGDPVEKLDVNYWRRQLRDPVQFERAMHTLNAQGHEVFVEIGPGTTLATLGKKSIDREGRIWEASIRRHRGEWEQMLDALGDLYVAGAKIDWNGFYRGYKPRRVAFPTYSFDRQSYWVEQTRPMPLRPPDVPATKASSDWYYKVAWRPGSIPNAAGTMDGRWLIVPDSRGFSGAFADGLRDKGATTSIGDSVAAASDLLRTGGYEHVLYLRALDAMTPPDGDLNAFAVGEKLAASDLLEISQAVLASSSPAKLWIVTQAAQPVLPHPTTLNVPQALAWGFARTFAVEHPAHWGGLVDLDANSAPAEASAAVLRSIAANDGEDQVAFRGDLRYLARLERVVPGSGPSVSFRPDRIYLIAGGLGGLGIKVAQWMAEHGARRLILASRKGLPDREVWDAAPASSEDSRSIAVIRELERLGVDVRTPRLDICDPQQVKELFKGAPPQEWGGIIQAAANVRADSVAHMTTEALETVLQPKTRGSWTLHAASKSLPLDFFVMFSSWTALLGANHLAHYTAANQFQDALAHYRRSIGLPALSLNWGAWEMMRGASPSELDSFVRGGLGLMRAEAGLDALGRAMGGSESQLAIAEINWAKIKPLYESRRPRPILNDVAATPVCLGKNIDAEPAGAAVKPSGPAISPREKLAGLIPEEKIARIERRLSESFAVILRSSEKSINPKIPITEFGVDSLMALEFKNRIAADYGVSIPTVRFLDGPAIEELAEQIASEVDEPARAAAPNAEADQPVEFPLAREQYGMWFDHQLSPHSAAYNLPFCTSAVPHIDLVVFRRAVNKLVQRHPLLRATYSSDERDMPVQRIFPDAEPEIQLIDAGDWSPEELKAAVVRDSRRPLPLDEPMSRVHIYRTTGTDVILVVIDHLIADAWSLRTWFKDLIALYEAELGQRTADLEPLQATFRDFVEWEISYLAGPASERDLSYWRTALEGAPSELRLPFARTRTGTPDVHGHGIKLELDRSLMEKVHRECVSSRITPFTLLLAAYKILLHRFSGEEDIVVGTSVSRRDDPRWMKVIGPFFNVLPLRSSLAGNPSMAELLSRVKQTVRNGIAHQAFPLSLMIERLKIKPRVDRSPIFQAFFNLVSYSDDLGLLLTGVPCELSFGSSTLNPFAVLREDQLLRQDIAIALFQIHDRMVGSLEYNADLIDWETARQLADAYPVILGAMVENLDLLLSDIPLSVDAGERDTMLL